MSSHLTPDDRPAAIRSAIVRTLHFALAATNPLDFAALRADVRRQIRSARRDEIGRALRELVDRGIVAAEVLERVHEFFGFVELSKTPVFRLIRQGESFPPAWAGHWWRVLVKGSGREASDG